MLISFAVTAKLICAFGFAYADLGLLEAAEMFELSEYSYLFCSKVDFYMSRPMGKPTICIGENKDADQLRGKDQLRGYREADQRLCFHYWDSIIPLLLKSEISSF